MDFVSVFPESTLPPTTRLFLALWPSAGTRRALAEHQARWTWPEGTALVDPNRLHLTLHFLGAVPEPEVARLADGLQVPSRPVQLTFTRPALWPRGRAVLLPGHVPSPLLDLQAELGQALRRLGCTVDERPFKPHVTLARQATDARPPEEPIAPVIWRAVAGYVLVQSRAGYRVLRRYPCSDLSE
jgi:2'-5' RNA ligase